VEVILFLTDGQGVYTPSGNPGSLADVAASRGYIIYTILLNSSPSGSYINPAPLIEIASVTGGEFYSAPTAENLEDIFNDIFELIVISTAPSDVNVIEVTQGYIIDEGSFTVMPDSVVDVAGETVITWLNVAQYVGNLDNRLTAEETFTVSFTVRSDQAGWMLPVEVEGSAQVTYVDPEGDPQSVLIPQGYLNVWLPICIDIKPGSFPNSINLKSRGVLPVAILTTSEFDACTVDPSTVEFAGATPIRARCSDVDRDGDMDQILFFFTQELDLTATSTSGVLTGMTYGGVPVIGYDSVRIVPPKK
jgi:hypothetical protein